MAKIDDKIVATGFRMGTKKTFEQVRELGGTAADRSAGVITKISESKVDGNSAIHYVVKRVGMLTVLSFGLGYVSGKNGEPNTVILTPGSYLTSRPTVFFIPVGPSDAAGYPSLKKFSDTMRASLAMP